MFDQPFDDSDRLKPCAHCGSDTAEVGQTDDGGYFIQCGNSMCGMSTMCMYATMDDPLPVLSEKWNKRPGGTKLYTSPPPTAEVPEPFLQICREELERSGLTSIPLKAEFAKRRGWALSEVEPWMIQTRRNFEKAVAALQSEAQAGKTPTNPNRTT